MKLSPGLPPSDDEDEQRSRVVNSLSYSYPGTSLSKALHAAMETDAGAAAASGPTDPLSQSCFADLRRVKQEPLDEPEVGGEELEEDEELTSLAWLQDADLLKNIACTSPTPEEADQKENSHHHPPHIPYNPQKHVNSKPPYSFSCLIFMAVEDSPEKKLPVKDIYNWILTHFPYFQNAPTGWKNSVRHNLSLNKCFKKVDKEKGANNIGKGSLWMIDPDFRPNLLQALRKTPYHPYHQLQMFSSSPSNSVTNGALPGGLRTAPFSTRVNNVNSPSPHLFPFLSRRLAQSNGNTVSPLAPPSGLESDIDVAHTLVSLKRAAESRRPLKCRNNGARSRSPSPPEFGSEREKEILKQKQLRASRKQPVFTSLPSEDHTYSLTAPPASPDSSIDDPYEFGRAPPTDSDEDFDEDEVSDEETEAVYRAAIQRIKADAAAASAAIPAITQRIIGGGGGGGGGNVPMDAEDAEGADALLNLAGINTAGMNLTLTPVHPPPSPTSLLFANNNNNNNNVVKAGGLAAGIVIKEEKMDES